MSCGSCSSGSCSTSGCGNNGNCGTGGCNRINTYDWLKDMVYPFNYKPFDIVEVAYKGNRKEFFRNSEGLDLYTGDAVVLETDGGHDLAFISLSGELVRLQLKKNGIDESNRNFRKIYRKATEKDLALHEELKSKESSTLEKARTIAMQMKLEMKLSDIEFQGDGRKVIFFYTSEGRVDFRELIKRYANEFKCRIEMRQVGYREEASRLGGIGSCGRVLCCSTWLKDYKHVSIQTAKQQNLSINMLKLSGQCGRLKCCLNYELDAYLEALSEFPKQEVVKLETSSGLATSQKTDILKRLMWFSYPHSSDWHAVPIERVKEIMAMNRRNEIPEYLTERVEVVQVEKLKGYGEADDIGEGSLTRLDRPKKKNFNKNKNFKPGSRPEGGNPEKQNPENRSNAQNQGPNPNRNKNRNKNRNRNNRNRGQGPKNDQS